MKLWSIGIDLFRNIAIIKLKLLPLRTKIFKSEIHTITTQAKLLYFLSKELVVKDQEEPN